MGVGGFILVVGMGRTCAKVVMLILAFDTCTTRRSVGEEDSYSFFRRRAKEVSLLRAGS
jgi:hypothetical protein